MPVPASRVTFEPSGLVVVTTSDVQAALAQVDAALAAGPVGAVGGHLTGTLPNPSLANGVVTNGHVAAGAAIAASKLDLSGTQTAIDQKFIPATSGWNVIAGTPVLGAYGPAGNIWRAWDLLADTAAETISIMFDVPPHWLTMKATALIGTSAASPTGNYLLRGDFGHLGPGEQPNITFGSNVTDAYSAQYVTRYVQLNASLTLQATELNFYRLNRLGTDAADTSTTTAKFLGLLLERVT